MYSGVTVLEMETRIRVKQSTHKNQSALYSYYNQLFVATTNRRHLHSRRKIFIDASSIINTIDTDRICSAGTSVHCARVSDYVQ